MRLKTGRTPSASAAPSRRFEDAGERGEPGVGEAGRLQHAQIGGVARQAMRVDQRFKVDDLLQTAR